MPTTGEYTVRPRRNLPEAPTAPALEPTLPVTDQDGDLKLKIIGDLEFKIKNLEASAKSWEVNLEEMFSENGTLIEEKTEIESQLKVLKSEKEVREEELQVLTLANQGLEGVTAHSAAEIINFRKKIAELEKETKSKEGDLQRVIGEYEVGKAKITELEEGIKDLNAEFEQETTDNQEELARIAEELEQKALNYESENSKLLVENAALTDEVDCGKERADQAAKEARESIAEKLAETEAGRRGAEARARIAEEAQRKAVVDAKEAFALIAAAERRAAINELKAGQVDDARSQAKRALEAQIQAEQDAADALRKKNESDQEALDSEQKRAGAVEELKRLQVKNGNLSGVNEALSTQNTDLQSQLTTAQNAITSLDDQSAANTELAAKLTEIQAQLQSAQKDAQTAIKEAKAAAGQSEAERVRAEQEAKAAKEAAQTVAAETARMAGQLSAAQASQKAATEKAERLAAQLVIAADEKSVAEAAARQTQVAIQKAQEEAARSAAEATALKLAAQEAQNSEVGVKEAAQRKALEAAEKAAQDAEAVQKAVTAAEAAAIALQEAQESAKEVAAALVLAKTEAVELTEQLLNLQAINKNLLTQNDELQVHLVTARETAAQATKEAQEAVAKSAAEVAEALKAVEEADKLLAAQKAAAQDAADAAQRREDEFNTANQTLKITNQDLQSQLGGLQKANQDLAEKQNDLSTQNNDLQSRLTLAQTQAASLGDQNSQNTTLAASLAALQVQLEDEKKAKKEAEEKAVTEVAARVAAQDAAAIVKSEADQAARDAAAKLTVQETAARSAQDEAKQKEGDLNATNQALRAQLTEMQFNLDAVKFAAEEAARQAQEAAQEAEKVAREAAETAAAEAREAAEQLLAAKSSEADAKSEAQRLVEDVQRLTGAKYEAEKAAAEAQKLAVEKSEAARLAAEEAQRSDFKLADLEAKNSNLLTQNDGLTAQLGAVQAEALEARLAAQEADKEKSNAESLATQRLSAQEAAERSEVEAKAAAARAAKDAADAVAKLLAVQEAATAAARALADQDAAAKSAADAAARALADQKAATAAAKAALDKSEEGKGGPRSRSESLKGKKKAATVDMGTDSGMGFDSSDGEGSGSKTDTTPISSAVAENISLRSKLEALTLELQAAMTSLSTRDATEAGNIEAARSAAKEAAERAAQILIDAADRRADDAQSEKARELATAATEQRSAEGLKTRAQEKQIAAEEARIRAEEEKRLAEEEKLASQQDASAAREAAEQANQEREAAQAAKDQSDQEKGVAQEERNKSNQERDAVRGALSAIKAANLALNSRLTALGSDLATLSATDKDAADRAAQAAVEALEAAKAETEAAKTETLTAQKESEDAKARTEAMKVERDEAKTEAEKAQELLRQNEENLAKVQEELAAANADLAVLDGGKEGDRLREELAALEASESALRVNNASLRGALEGAKEEYEASLVRLEPEAQEREAQLTSEIAVLKQQLNDLAGLSAADRAKLEAQIAEKITEFDELTGRLTEEQEAGDVKEDENAALRAGNTDLQARLSELDVVNAALRAEFSERSLKLKNALGGSNEQRDRALVDNDRLRQALATLQAQLGLRPDDSVKGRKEWSGGQVSLRQTDVDDDEMEGPDAVGRRRWSAEAEASFASTGESDDFGDAIQEMEDEIARLKTELESARSREADNASNRGKWGPAHSLASGDVEEDDGVLVDRLARPNIDALASGMVSAAMAAGPHGVEIQGLMDRIAELEVELSSARNSEADANAVNRKNRGDPETPRGFSPLDDDESSAENLDTNLRIAELEAELAEARDQLTSQATATVREAVLVNVPIYTRESEDAAVDRADVGVQAVSPATATSSTSTDTSTNVGLEGEVLVIPAPVVTNPPKDPVNNTSYSALLGRFNGEARSPLPKPRNGPRLSTANSNQGAVSPAGEYLGYVEGKESSATVRMPKINEDLEEFFATEGGGVLPKINTAKFVNSKSKEIGTVSPAGPSNGTNITEPLNNKGAVISDPAALAGLFELIKNTATTMFGNDVMKYHGQDDKLLRSTAESQIEGGIRTVTMALDKITAASKEDREGLFANRAYCKIMINIANKHSESLGESKNFGAGIGNLVSDDEKLIASAEEAYEYAAGKIDQDVLKSSLLDIKNNSNKYLGELVRSRKSGMQSVGDKSFNFDSYEKKVVVPSPEVYYPEAQKQFVDQSKGIVK